MDRQDRASCSADPSRSSASPSASSRPGSCRPSSTPGRSPAQSGHLTLDEARAAPPAGVDVLVVQARPPAVTRPHSRPASPRTRCRCRNWCGASGPRRGRRSGRPEACPEPGRSARSWPRVPRRSRSERVLLRTPESGASAVYKAALADPRRAETIVTEVLLRPARPRPREPVHGPLPRSRPGRLPGPAPPDQPVAQGLGRRRRPRVREPVGRRGLARRYRRARRPHPAAPGLLTTAAHVRLTDEIRTLPTV